ncbi:uncharacterized protein STEHIDRAFT_117009 [Stereum hirsutum FP-91666 SS1]|uniref:uncharacterized protein n=1 Tax=Stereum hirsutum (strain FP-91666) TaxID=721885 RepID=UPI000440C4CE|nr:uncharacterized protein STEHIDRAFT_117009 [Stereum hirsutum FP-91666 SS1]EIM91895.1 hypothetical protein STEHIDRAFT_117009 [Stereum hirsutum FP-91666 SS1]
MFEVEDVNSVIYHPRVLQDRNLQLLTNASDVEVLCGPHTELQTWVPNPIAKTCPHAAAQGYEPEDTPFRSINRRCDRDWWWKLKEAGKTNKRVKKCTNGEAQSRRVA